jgi:hypothetical protein
MELKAQGRSLSEIGQALGVSKQAAHKMVKAAIEVRKEEIAEHADDLRVTWAERIEAATRAIWPAVMAGDLAATDRFVKLADRFARLTGLDLRPPDVEVNIGPQFIVTSLPPDRPGYQGADVIESTAVAVPAAQLEGLTETSPLVVAARGELRAGPPVSARMDALEMAD